VVQHYEAGSCCEEGVGDRQIGKGEGLVELGVEAWGDLGSGEDLAVAGELELRTGQASLVGANGAVSLDAVTTVDLNFALVIHPWHTEHDHALGLDKTLQNLRPLVFGMLVNTGLKAFENLFDGL